ncbi:MAG TPA: DUF3971 domain-containing protein [Steroidobacteraceae bacterium]|nr:DUF3971 domain-containing protein [Steroidobacteraceae bacterium]
MAVRVAPFEPAAGPVSPAAADAAETVPAGTRLRLAAWAVGAAAILGAAVVIAWELAAARVPQQRAALEDLIREQTGLDVTFRELSVRWGWYGPEAVFDHVVLGEPGGGGALLRAPKLVVGLDAWRMVRSGEFAAGRITLVEPDIDLAAGARTARTNSSRSAREAASSAGARLLSRWRGGRIDLEGGTLHWPLPGSAAPVTVNVRYAQLRRLAPAWDADVELLLPATLGERAHLAVHMRGESAAPHALSGTLTFDGRRLELAAWRAVARDPPLERYLPEGGVGNLELSAEFADGRLLRTEGKLLAEGLEWRSPPVAGTEAFGVGRLRGEWRLARDGAEWRLEARAQESTQESGKAAAATVDASIEVATDGSTAHGRVEGAPLPLVAAVARGYAPQLPLSKVRLEGVAREILFDFSARHPAGERLKTSAQLEDLAVASPAGELALGGLTAHVSGVDARLTADLHSSAAQLRAGGEQAVSLDGLAVAARLAIDAQRGGWQLKTEELSISRADLALAASGALGAEGSGATRLSAHVALRQADVAELARLVGPAALAALAPGASQLTAGRIENADLEWRGLLDSARPWSGAGSEFRGAFELRDATLTGSDSWPDVRHLDAHVDWRGPRLHAAVEAGDAGTFQLAAASADWDALGARPLHLEALLTASAQPALAWLRAHPQLAAYAPGMQDVDLRGDTLLDVDVIVPASSGAAARARHAPRARSRITALLDGVQLRAVAGLPPIGALHGTLAYAAGHLQPSQLTGQWLGGPVTLGIAERRDSDGTALTISGRGLADARQALRAAGAHDDRLEGHAEWSALLTFLPGSDSASSRWRLRADSSLMDVSSRLPEPFAKAEGLALPLHVEVQAGAVSGQLRLALGERLRAAAALNRSGDLWRIERGAVRLASTAPALPAEPQLLLEGRMSRLDLLPLLALWRQAGQDAALPPLRARLSAAQLTAGTRSFAEVSVAAEATPRGGRLELESPEISGTTSWPAVVDAEHPARVGLSRLNLTQPDDAVLGAGLAAAIGPAVGLSIDDLQWQGRSLGSLRAQLATGPESFDAIGLELAGPSGESEGSVHCRDAACRVRFSLDSRDAAATLRAFGFRPDLTASHARLEGELQWPQQGAPSLATLDGRLHMQLEQGVTRSGAAGAGGSPFALLIVPALTAGLRAENRDGILPELGFSRLTADFAVHGGQATTSNLHFDGDAEILVRGRTGLLGHDYDEQAWILRGEERLPAAVRRLGATPKVAAVWLSLRELFSGPAADRTRAALRLRGTWEEPLVISAD